MYDRSLYDVDADKRLRYEAAIQTGAYLYRLASPNHCMPEHVLSGRGSLKARDDGRFHIQQQQVSYCANNVLVTFAEVLFHMYKLVLKRLGEKQRVQAVRDAAVARRFLTVFQVNEIKDLVFIDSEGLQIEFDARIRGASVVYPEATYDIFLDLTRTIRGAGKKGIVYPSARHSQDFCFALFDDESDRVDKLSFRRIEVQLSLLAEDQNMVVPVRGCNPFQDKLHATMGYYEILDRTEFDKAKLDRILYPEDLPASGYIDFVRRRYEEYPKQAVCPH
jgi:hypothetical protein